MSGRLIALEKKPGVRLVGFRETWRRLFANIFLKVTGQEDTATCKYYKLCAVIKAGIDSTVHGVKAIWDENSSTEDRGFLLVDAKNAFNDIN